MSEPKVLTTLPDSTSWRRLQVVLVERSDGRVVFGLREQLYSSGVGWFDQRAVELEPIQWRQLQGYLGRGGQEQRPAEDGGPVLLPIPASSADRGRGSHRGRSN